MTTEDLQASVPSESQGRVRQCQHRLKLNVPCPGGMGLTDFVVRKGIILKQVRHECKVTFIIISYTNPFTWAFCK